MSEYAVRRQQETKTFVLAGLALGIVDQPIASHGRLHGHLFRTFAKVELMTSEADDALRVLRIRQLFETRSAQERAETDIAVFYAWLHEHYPDFFQTVLGASHLSS